MASVSYSNDACAQNVCEAPKQEFMMPPCQSAAAQVFLVPAGYPALVMTPFGPAMPMQLPHMSAQIATQMVPAETLMAPTYPAHPALLAHPANSAPAQLTMEQSDTIAKGEPNEPCLLTCGGIPCSTVACDELPHPDDLPSASLLAKSAELSDVVAEQMESCDRARLGVILRWLQKATLELAFSAYGCRVVQKAFEVAGGDDRTALVDQLRGNVVKLVESPHGNHVLQKCIVELRFEAVRFVLDEIPSEEVSSLAQHKFGCRVLQRLLERHGQVSRLVEAVLADLIAIAQSPYGNYVVQLLLECPGVGAEQRERLLRLVEASVEELGSHPFGCIVLSAALSKSPPASGLAIARAILQAPCLLGRMACTRHGHRTTLAVVDLLQGDDLEEARRCLSAVEQIAANRFGRVVIARLA